MFFVSGVVFYILVIKRRRFEFPYMAIPICFMISGLIGVGIELFILSAEASGDNDVGAEIAFPLTFHYMFYTDGQQFFASLYLQAALSLPIMFSQAKLQYAARNPDTNNGAFHNNEIIDELQESERAIEDGDIVKLGEEITKVTNERRQKLNRINACTHLLNLAVVLLALASCSVAIIASEYIYIASCCLITFKNVILGYSIIRFQNFTKEKKFTLPNERLVILHFTNIAIYTILYVACCAFNILFENRKADGSSVL